MIDGPRVFVDVGVMAMNVYVLLLRDQELEPHQQMQYGTWIFSRKF